MLRLRMARMEAGRAEGVGTLSVVWRALSLPAASWGKRDKVEVGKGPDQVEYRGKEERAKL